MDVGECWVLQKCQPVGCTLVYSCVDLLLINKNFAPSLFKQLITDVIHVHLSAEGFQVFES